jgi:hypothetical protein
MLTLSNPHAVVANADRTGAAAGLGASVRAVLALRLTQLADDLDDWPLSELVTFHVAKAVAGLTPAEREHYEERAAILEYDAGFPRREAERRALAEILDLRARKLRHGV